MFHKIDKQIFAGAGNLRGTVVNQDVNGLIFVASKMPTINDYITVTLKSSQHEPIPVLPRINLAVLSDISNILGGFNNLAQEQENSQNNLDANLQYVTNFYSIAIDLGCLKNLSNDASLEVICELSQAQTAGVYTYFTQDLPDRLYTYSQSNVLTDNVKNCQRLFIFSPISYSDDIFGHDVNVMVRNNGQAVASDLAGLVGGTIALSTIETNPPPKTLILFRSMDDIPDTVDYNISGSWASNFSVISVCERLISTRVSRGTIESSMKLNNRMVSYEPEKLRALKRAGRIPDLQAVRAALPQLNVK